MGTDRRSFLAAAASAATFPPKASASAETEALDASRTIRKLRLSSGREVDVIYRKLRPVSDPGARYPGFKPETKVLTAGLRLREGGRALPVDIVYERDVAVPLRDGSVIYADIFRPAHGDEKVPAIIGHSPYGKTNTGYWTLDLAKDRSGVPISAVSELQKFEGPDPAEWVQHGYAIVAPDTRGAFASPGDIDSYGRGRFAEDGYDIVEWIAQRDWCSGKVALTGNSWLAISQWFIGAARPPHLAAIAPWEGRSDQFRESYRRGGVPSTQFLSFLTDKLYGAGYAEDCAAMVAEHPFMDAYWEDKIPNHAAITVPAYVVASWTGGHSNGTLAGFRNISSKEKWLRVHNTQEWPDYYDPKYVADLRKFYDRYLKGDQNGWETTPKVRISVLEPGGEDTVDRPVADWPPPGQTFTKLYLDAGNAGLSERIGADGATRYPTTADARGKAIFALPAFDRDTEIIGHMSAKLWVEVEGADDADLYLAVQKAGRDGKVLGIFNTGILRISRRELDPVRSTPSEPYLLHKRNLPLRPGQIVPVEVGIWAGSMRWRKGEQLRLVISARHETETASALGTGRGVQVIHTGAKFPSYLLVPTVSVA